jgi:transcriptional regulator with XRE-family HTH domain
MRERKVGLLWERLWHFRQALGLTQEQRETASGVPQWRIASIAGGIAENVHASIVIGFAKALYVSADYLLGLKEEKDGEQQEETTAPKS